ncbi:MAG TPA: prepilin-type N-terminal cleavage/methylation domain-containing protein [Candidatus Sulfotelmatobacter sp.]|nr:prepilin-type N-terminal cleavage/methylation domain-containing protein [Candidatus Sulfotelmatobacter sp.]
MKPNLSSCLTRAFTLVELLVVIAIIGILAALLMPVLNKAESRAKRIVCVNGLGQVGLAFHTFSGDHNGKFPMAVSTNDGGSLEYVESGFAVGEVFYTAYLNFRPLSPELVQPQLLICPSDQRAAATNFASLQNTNLSYFVGVEGTFDKPTSILAGDRNLATNSFDQPTILGFGPESDLGWTWELHQFKGNMVFADGHVEQWNNFSLDAGETSSPFEQSFFMPSVLPDIEVAAGGSGGSGSGGSGGSGSGGSGGSSGSGGSGSSGSSASSGTGSAGSGSSSSYPSALSSGPAGGAPANQSPAAQTGPIAPNSSSDQGLSQTEGANESGPSGSSSLASRPAVKTSGSVTNEGVLAQDPNSAMAPFDRHMTAVLQRSLLWLYLLLCLLVLLYLLYRMQKRMREKQAARRSRSPDSFD